MKEKKRKSENRISRKTLVISIIMIIIIVVAITFIKRNKENDEGNSTVEQNTVESYVEEIEAGVKINKSTKLNEAKEVNGLLVTNIQLTAESGITTLLADVTNNTGNRTEAKVVNITLLDYEGQELTTVTGIIKELNVGETTQLNISLTSDYVNAYDFRVEMN